MKIHYERKNPINWKKDKCVIYKMPLKIKPLGAEICDDDFFIQYEHKFLRNIYITKQLNESIQLCAIENYYKTYQKYIRICSGLLSVFNSFDAWVENEDLLCDDLKGFIDVNYPEDTLEELKKNRISQTQIKNFVNIPKFNLKIYDFVYEVLIDFPITEILYDLITTNRFFVNVHGMIKSKI